MASDREWVISLVMRTTPARSSAGSTDHPQFDLGPQSSPWTASRGRTTLTCLEPFGSSPPNGSFLDCTPFVSACRGTISYALHFFKVLSFASVSAFKCATLSPARCSVATASASLRRSASVRELLAIPMMIVHTKGCHRIALWPFRATLRD